MKLFSSLGRDLGIDIGTFHTHIFVEGRGVVVSEPSIVATDAKQENIVTVGEDAHRLLLRNPETLAPMSPLKEGFIVDYRIVLSMLKYFMNKASKAVRRSRVVMAVWYYRCRAKSYDGCHHSGRRSGSAFARKPCSSGYRCRTSYF